MSNYCYTQNQLGLSTLAEKLRFFPKTLFTQKQKSEIGFTFLNLHERITQLIDFYLYKFVWKYV